MKYSENEKKYLNELLAKYKNYELKFWQKGKVIRLYDKNDEYINLKNGSAKRRSAL